jgi:hypothetical protein
MTQAPAAAGGPVRVFVSYSHDSSSHLERVLELSNRLRAQGVDCHIDQYEMSPPEGWPAWMSSQIENARFVLVVCTETYARRVGGREAPGKGLGAQWEGAVITHSLYEAGGRNEKFIPVIFAGADAQHVPPFLRPVTRYDLSTSSGYEDLYRHLTSQPRVIKPPLGAVEPKPPVQSVPNNRPGLAESGRTSDMTERLLIMSFGGAGTYVIPLDRADVGKVITITLIPASAEQSAFLTQLRQDRDHEIGVAFGLFAVLGRVKEAQQEYAAGGERWRLVVAAQDTDYGAGFMEMSTGGYSADDIAQLRARRILLNDLRSGTGREDVVAYMNDSTLEVLIRGLNSPLQVNASPLPDLFAQTGEDREAFIRIARLLLVLYLRLSGTVEHVFALDLTFESDDRLRVDFEGQRAKKYTNEPAPRISVHGTCVLRQKSAG